MVRQAPVICVMVPPIHLGAWSMLWLPFELLLLLCIIALSLTQVYQRYSEVVCEKVRVGEESG